MAAPKKTRSASSSTARTAAKKAAGKKAVSKRAPVTKKAPAKRAAAKKAPAKKAPAKRAAAKKPAAAKKAPAKKVAAKKAPARKAPAKKAAAKKAAAKKAPARKAPAKKPAAAKKAPARKAPAKKAGAAKKAAKKTPSSTPTTRTRQTVPPKRNVQPKQKSALPSLLSNDIPEQVEIPKPRGTNKDGISYTKDFDVKFLKAQREELLARRAAELARATRLEEEATSLIEDGEMGDVQFDDEGGEGDTMVVQRDLDRLLSGQARQTVEEIDAALERIEQGTYGYSVVSGKPIPRERLEAIPETTVLAVEKVSGAGLR